MYNRKSELQTRSVQGVWSLIKQEMKAKEGIPANALHAV